MCRWKPCSVCGWSNDGDLGGECYCGGSFCPSCGSCREGCPPDGAYGPEGPECSEDIPHSEDGEENGEGEEGGEGEENSPDQESEGEEQEDEGPEGVRYLLRGRITVLS